ncbi:hypothetical protein [Streptomyces sp. CC210A]|uniref:hypothetical protein n=1 Tax=Streptomyces sp. CC210A TaxID=2898184 RepID=UPI0027E58C04|nr:hypothetical protein [Streptomyces sp. CC210A]
MTEQQVSRKSAEFAHWLGELTALIDPGRGWYGVFLTRDPDGTRACVSGAELPPWDVVEALLHDFAQLRGEESGRTQTARARRLHAAAAAERDARPGARRALLDRLRPALREQARTAERARELLERTGPDEAGPLAHHLAWLRDDHDRATARVAELRARLAALPQESAQRPAALRPDPAAPAENRGRGRRPRGARYAWLDDSDGDAGPVAAPPEAGPAATAGAAPTGARFGGGGGDEEPPPPAPPEAGPVSASDRSAVAHAVAVLVDLRARGRSGEAHALLCEAARWPAVRLPLLATALDRAGLAADWATLLGGGVPADRAPGRPGRGARRRRPGGRRRAAPAAGRDPAGEDVAAAVTGTRASCWGARALVEVFVAVRSPEDTAHFAACAPQRLVPEVLRAARAAAPARETAVVHALRVAGLVTG